VVNSLSDRTIKIEGTGLHYERRCSAVSTGQGTINLATKKLVDAEWVIARILVSLVIVDRTQHRCLFSGQCQSLWTS
jgi:hypothetical protein